MVCSSSSLIVKRPARFKINCISLTSVTFAAYSQANKVQGHVSFASQ